MRSSSCAETCKWELRTLLHLLGVEMGMHGESVEDVPGAIYKQSSAIGRRVLRLCNPGIT